jgi:hypothetical protein
MADSPWAPMLYSLTSLILLTERLRESRTCGQFVCFKLLPLLIQRVAQSVG